MRGLSSTKDIKRASHSCRSSPKTATAQRRVWIVFLLNLSFCLVEFVGGVLTGSVAILADAFHDFGDTLSLGLAAFLEARSSRKPSSTFSYGYRRLSLLSSLMTAVVLVAGSIVVIAGAISRFWEVHEPHSVGMMGLAVLGITVNGGAALILAKGRTQNEKVLGWHFLEDLLGWLSVLVGAAFIYFFGWNWLDPLLALFISLFILYHVWGHLSQTLRLFLQAVPASIDQEVLIADLEKVEGISEIHDLHIWSLDGLHHVISLHAKIGQGDADIPAIKACIRERLAGWGEFHCTIEVETPAEDCVSFCTFSQYPGQD